MSQLRGRRGAHAVNVHWVLFLTLQLQVSLFSLPVWNLALSSWMPWRVCENFEELTWHCVGIAFWLYLTGCDATFGQTCDDSGLRVASGLMFWCFAESKLSQMLQYDAGPLSPPWLSRINFKCNPTYLQFEKAELTPIPSPPSGRRSPHSRFGAVFATVHGNDINRCSSGHRHALLTTASCWS